MAVYAAKASAATVDPPSDWPHGWPFPPEGGPDGPWPPGFPDDIEDTILVRQSTTTAKYSQDDGDTWSNVTLPFGSTSTNRIWCGSGNLLYFINPGSVSGGVQTIACYLSLDGGMTWNTRGTISLTTAGTTSLYCACYDDMLYLSTMPDGNEYATGLSVWYSSDGGATFTENVIVASAFGGGAPGDIATLSDGTVAVLYDDYAAGTDCYTSATKGVTFAKAGTIPLYGGNIRWLAADAADDNLVATGSGGMQFSSDSGATWASKSTTAHGACVSYGDNMLSCISSKLRQSADNGATWTDSDALAVSTAMAHSLAAWSNGFAVMSVNKIYVSTTTSGFVVTDADPGVTVRGFHLIEET